MKFRAYVLIMAIVVVSASSADGQPICTIRDGEGRSGSAYSEHRWDLGQL
ncbi:MAG: hypothetical protein IID38_07240 [Planctomycetes bacterium]|nr:hypothetical protein [Planctomycetota bacterium]